MGEVSDTHLATPGRLVGAARALMIEHGVLEVSLAAIAERAKVNVALVSYHFGGREGLMVAIARDDAQRALADLDRLLAADMPPSAKIAAHIAGIIRAYAARPYLNRLLQKLLREGSAQAREQVGEFFSKPVAAARRTIIEQGIAAGCFRRVDPGLVGFAIEGACSQIFTSPEARAAVLGDGAMTDALLDRYAATIADLVVGGLTAKPVPAGKIS